MKSMLMQTIRKFPLISGLWVLLALGFAGAPLLAQADVFIRKNTKSEKPAETEKKGSYFLRPSESKDEPPKDHAAYYKKKTIKVIDHSEQIAKFGITEADPYLLSMVGPDPESAEDILKRAQAYRVPQFQAAYVLQQQDGYRANVAMLNAERAGALMAAKGTQNREDAGGEEIVVESKEEAIPADSKVTKTVTKPKKFFNRN